MEEKNKKTTIFFLGFLVVVLLVFLGYLLMKTIEEREVAKINEKFISDRGSVLRLINEANSYQDAIKKTEKLLEAKEFTDSGQEASLKILLASSYINILNKEDFKKGTDILKELATNANYPAMWRAMALDRLASFVAYQGASFAKENIFNDDYFSPMMKEGDLGVAIRRLDERSLSLFETVVPRYRISNWYALRLIENEKLSGEDRKIYLQLAKDNLEKGKTLFDKDYPKNPWDDERLIMAYQLYGEAAAKLYLLKEFDDSQKIMDSFDAATKVYEKKYDFKDWPVVKSKIISPVLRKQLPSLIFSYAASAAVVQNQANQDKIKPLMEILYNKEWDEPSISNVFSFFRNEKNTVHDKQYHRLKIVALAKADSRFADLLVSLGWNKEQLNNLPILPFESVK